MHSAVYLIGNINKVDRFGYDKGGIHRAKPRGINGRNVLFHVFYADCRIFGDQHAVIALAVVRDGDIVDVNDGRAIQIKTAEVDGKIDVFAVFNVCAAFRLRNVRKALAAYKGNRTLARVHNIRRAVIRATARVVRVVFPTADRRKSERAREGK